MPVSDFSVYHGLAETHLPWLTSISAEIQTIQTGEATKPKAVGL
jgi:hypothetical protein